MADLVGLLVMRYAFPCADISVVKGTITQEEYDALRAALEVGESLPRTRLERFFPALTRRLKEVAERDALKEYWSIEAVNAYFLKYHDEYINKGDGLLGEMLPCEKELCRCKIGKVVRLIAEPERILIIERDGKEEKVLGKYLPEAEEGELVVVHRRFATEVLSAETAAVFGYPRM